MVQLDKLVEKFLREAPDVSFTDVVRVLEAFGYEERPSGGGSHWVFVKRGHQPKIVPTVKGRRVKRPYVRMIINNLELEEWYETRHRK